MYNLPEFKDHSPTFYHDFIARHPFALLCGCDPAGKPIATQLPILLREENGKVFLRGHIMKDTDHHQALEQNPEVLLVFTGPHAYVSASWYTNPVMGSTWNYLSVQAHGRIRWMDEAELRQLMQELSLHFEGGNLQSPTVFNNLPKAYTDALVQWISGIEVEVEKLEQVVKLSQNRDAESYRNIQARLRAQGGQAAELAQEMEKRYEGLFGG